MLKHISVILNLKLDGKSYCWNQSWEKLSTSVISGNANRGGGGILKNYPKNLPKIPPQNFEKFF